MHTARVPSAVRAQVLGPLSLAAAGARPSGVRRIERRAPELATALRATAGLTLAPGQHGPTPRDFAGASAR